MWHSLAGPNGHFMLEAAAYLIGARIYWPLARQQPQPPIEDRLLLLGGAVLGALLGSQGLHLMQHLPALLERNELALWLGGKSVLGGFVGGTLGVELDKRLVGWSRSTGDPWVPALAAGLMIGRLGCQLSGNWDSTYGTPTSLGRSITTTTPMTGLNGASWRLIPKQAPPSWWRFGRRSRRSLSLSM